MPYQPSERELDRMRRAIDLARLGEVERILWISVFLVIVLLDLFLIAKPPASSYAVWIGIAGVTGGSLFLYARLRAFHLARKVRGHAGLFGPGLARGEQRMFTALMFRSILIGRNPLEPRAHHDPRRWDQHSGSYVAAPPPPE